MAIRQQQGPTISETEAYNILRNDRRREVIRHLQLNVGAVSLNDLAEKIAERESGTSPPPRNKRQSVYNSLHQTHLPKLDKREIIEYDQRGKRVELNDTRNIHRYMNVMTSYGITWGEYYRTIGLVALLVLLATELNAPVIGSVDMLLWLSVFLLLIGASTLYQVHDHLYLLYRRIRLAT